MSTLKLTIKHGKASYDISADGSSLVSDLMQQIEGLTGVLIREQKLVCQGKVLSSAVSLEASKVRSGAKLMLLAGGSQTQVFDTVLLRNQLPDSNLQHDMIPTRVLQHIHLLSSKLNCPVGPSYSTASHQGKSRCSKRARRSFQKKTAQCDQSLCTNILHAGTLQVGQHRTL